MSRRVERLNEQFKRELMDIIRLHVRDPRVAEVTVTRVEATADLRYARVFLTTLQPEAERTAILEGLEAAAPFVRGELARRLTVRRTPELRFQWDQTLDHARRIEQLLSEVRPTDGGEAAHRDSGPDVDAGDDDAA